MYLNIGEVDGYIEEKNGSKYLVFASTDKKKEVLKKYAEVWDEIKSLIEKINDKPGEYGKDFMKIKFSSDDKLSFNKTLKLHNLTVDVRPLFQEENKCYRQILLDECLYEL